MKNISLALVFWLVLIFFLISGITGIFLDIRYYPVARAVIRHIHIWLSYITLILLLIHLVQNWQWVKNLSCKFSSLATRGKSMVFVFWGMMINFILVNLTGISLHLKFIVLPRGWTKHLHDYTGYLFIIFSLIHLYQNRSYIIKLFKR